MKMRFRWYLSIAFLFLFYYQTLAQGHDWWANNVDWDGSTHWSRYIIASPDLMGPNALPIPDLDDGRIQNEHFFKFSAWAHLSKGDHTFNPRLQFTYAMVPERISFDLFMVPVEYFNMSHEKKTERRTFHVFYDRKLAIGDLYLHTNIQLTKKKWDSRLRLGFKYASSSMQGMARFTDAPGYYFDLSAGKDLPLGVRKIRFMIMAGFYVWQTNSDTRFQNDAFLFGLGGRYCLGKFMLESHIRGYAGYLNHGDHPIVWKTQVSRERKPFRFELGYQRGLHDFDYHSLELGAVYWLNSDLQN